MFHCGNLFLLHLNKHTYRNQKLGLCIIVSPRQLILVTHERLHVVLSSLALRVCGSVCVLRDCGHSGTNILPEMVEGPGAAVDRQDLREWRYSQ